MQLRCYRFVTVLSFLRYFSRAPDFDEGPEFGLFFPSNRNTIFLLFVKISEWVDYQRDNK